MNTEKATLHQLLKGFGIGNFNRVLYAKILIHSNLQLVFPFLYHFVLVTKLCGKTVSREKDWKDQEGINIVNNKKETLN